jgi:hypothetical protein
MTRAHCGSTSEACVENSRSTRVVPSTFSPSLVLATGSSSSQRSSSQSLQRADIALQLRRIGLFFSAFVISRRAADRKMYIMGDGIAIPENTNLFKRNLMSARLLSFLASIGATHGDGACKSTPPRFPQRFLSARSRLATFRDFSLGKLTVLIASFFTAI